MGSGGFVKTKNKYNEFNNLDNENEIMNNHMIIHNIDDNEINHEFNIINDLSIIDNLNLLWFYINKLFSKFRFWK